MLQHAQRGAFCQWFGLPIQAGQDYQPQIVCPRQRETAQTCTPLFDAMSGH